MALLGGGLEGPAGRRGGGCPGVEEGLDYGDGAVVGGGGEGVAESS